MIDLPFEAPVAFYAGVDEVGRGPLAGDVLAAAVILHPERPISGLADSKVLSEKQRNRLYDAIVDRADCFAVARATVAEIDRLNIFQATLLAMARAVSSLGREPGFVAVDGKHVPKWRYPSQALIKGDSRVPAISAAAIIAKVTRDREMVAFDAVYPGYGFADHKGYGTARHLAALRSLGPTPLHRRSFRPVRDLLNGTEADPESGAGPQADLPIG